jgi:Cu(I)/Ag(I) efflux system membrane fusion protein
MKTKWLIALTFTILAGAGSVTFFSRPHSHCPKPEKNEDAPISHYTCPMHPHIHEDAPGECPICHMKLVPVYKQDAEQKASPQTSSAVNISSKKQQLVGIRTVSAMKKSVIKEIRAPGRVAFDPELAIAQKEYLQIARSIPSLKREAVSRLRLMGMSEEEIQDLGKRGRADTSLVLPSSGDSLWVYATLYQRDLEWVKRSTPAEVFLFNNAQQKFSGVVRSIDPVVDPLTRSVRARIEVKNAEEVLKPESFVQVIFKVELGQAITIPKSAVIDTGTRQVVFVSRVDGKFEERAIQLGAEMNDEWVVIQGISEGEKIVSTGTFLVDSESQLKAAVSSLETTPACPKGESWDPAMAMCMGKAGH